VNFPPVFQACVFWIVWTDTSLETCHARIVDQDIGHRNAFPQATPVRFLPHIERYELAADLGGGRAARFLVDVG
jgi:hypothetical protein